MLLIKFLIPYHKYFLFRQLTSVLRQIAAERRWVVYNKRFLALNTIVNLKYTFWGDI